LNIPPPATVHFPLTIMPPLTESDDHIKIDGLSVSTFVGVPDAERASAQTLILHLTLWPQRGLGQLGDDFAHTVDYAAADALCRAIVTDRPRHLIETVAEDVGLALLRHYPLAQVRVIVEKFILPDTRSVSVSLTRTRDSLHSKPQNSP
jgi:7,8-dihydroneopterin aldolase/epimerase/oxygenase